MPAKQGRTNTTQDSKSCTSPWVCSFSEEEKLWQSGVRPVAGIDEAGRGPLAGPVVVAAVILPEDFRHARLNDSKKLSSATREEIFGELSASREIIIEIAVIEPRRIDELNILRATWAGMEEVLCHLKRHQVEHALIDGNPVPGLSVPSTALVKGDARSLSIAAASVAAKVTRDRLMIALDEEFPQYGFAQHKGYPTSAHLEALRRYGPCPHHRQSFAPVAEQYLAL